MARKASTAGSRRDTPHKLSAPQAMRPVVPGYDFSTKQSGLLPWKWAADRLRKSRQYWIATTRPDGSPHLMIIWGVRREDGFWFSTGASSRKARNLARNPRCVIGTDDAAEAVILEGSVEAIDVQRPELDSLAAAYARKYRWDLREMAQPVYRFRPTVGFGLYEKKFDQTATRWQFR
jgi:hypothetical protein